MRYNAKQFISRFRNNDNVELYKILDDLPLSPDGIWLAGGALRRTLLNSPLDSDFDFFFSGAEKLTEFRNSILEKGASKLGESEHVENYNLNVNDKNIIIQLVKINFYESPEAVIDTFDFTITQLAYDGSDLIVGEYTLWDLARKKLALHKLTYGVSTMRRLLKYTKQGFTACNGVMEAILEAVVENPQLINSDVQYVD